MDNNDVAVIGMSCRFPQANSIDEYWQLLCGGMDTISEVPKERWDIDKFYDSDLAAKGKMNTRYGGFIDDVEWFDASFFGISPREAMVISPQQRILLEVSWNALEHAAIAPGSLAGKSVGCFMGVASFDYYERILEDTDRIDGYTLTGNAYSVTANRISYAFDFRGPSVAIDTACSSSLVAIHYACQSLLSGESELALAGGAQIIASPWITVAASKGAFMAPDGRCKAFDAKANGYVRGEGVGVVVLKKLDKAIKDKDPILAVIKGSAVNQDGKSNGLTAPNLKAQENVLRQAYHNARIKAADVGYIEAHGTGTQLGDPIEVSALSRVLSEGREKKQSCLLGSVKTNIGHLEAAAGIAGFIKTVLTVQNGLVPANVHFNRPNSEIDFENSPFKVSERLQSWHANTSRTAGVSSFGFGGTNAHIVVQQAPEEVSVNDVEYHGNYPLLVLSAKTKSSLLARVESAIEILQSERVELTDLIRSFAIGRQHLKYRLAIFFESKADLQSKLTQLLRENSGECFKDLTPTKRSSKVAWLFTGQGSQYWQMGKQLYQREKVFTDTIDRCHYYINKHFGFSILDLVFSDTSSDEAIMPTAVAQPAIFAVEAALSKLLLSWGLKPNILLGHSLGEYTAMYVSGMITLEDGLKIVGSRGALMQTLDPEQGVMISVFLGEEKIKPFILGYESKVSVAAINGTEHTVLSGDSVAIQTIMENIRSSKANFKKLDVSHAFHSPLMQPIVRRFKNMAEQIQFSHGNIPIISNVTGKELENNSQMPDYLVEHILSSVQFVQSMKSLQREDIDVYCEIGPGPVLSTLGSQVIGEADKFTYTLKRNQNNWHSMSALLAKLYTQGIELDWATIMQKENGTRVNMPGYTFERKRFWVLDEIVTANQSSVNKIEHPFLAQATKEKDEQGRLKIMLPLSTRLFPYLSEHKVHGADIIPSTVYIEIAQSIGKYFLKTEFNALGNLEFNRPFIVNEENSYIQMLIDLADDDRRFYLGNKQMKLSDPGSICVQGKFITNYN